MRKLLPHHTACLCQRASLYEKLDPLAWGQGADDAAVRNRSLLALAQQVVQHPAQRFQVGNLPVNVGQVVSRHRVHCAAVVILVVGQPQQGAYLIQSEAQVTRTADEVSTVGLDVAVRLDD